MMWYWGTGMHWWGWTLGLLGMVVFWGVMIWGIWYVITRIVSPAYGDHGDHRDDGDHGNHRADGARRTLDQRLAHGDIDPDEYRRLRDLIEENGPPLIGSGDREGPNGPPGGPGPRGTMTLSRQEVGEADEREHCG